MSLLSLAYSSLAIRCRYNGAFTVAARADDARASSSARGTVIIAKILSQLKIKLNVHAKLEVIFPICTHDFFDSADPQIVAVISFS